MIALIDLFVLQIYQMDSKKNGNIFSERAQDIGRQESISHMYISSATKWAGSLFQEEFERVTNESS